MKRNKPDLSAYTAILFDFDNTLTDFHASSVASFADLLLSHGITQTAEHYPAYEKINSALWRKFENKQATADDIRALRFKEFYDQQGWPLDDPLQANDDYLEGILRHTAPIEGVENLLRRLHTTHYLAIVTNGLREIQRRRIDHLGWTQYFDDITVSDEIGYAKPSSEFYDVAFAKIPTGTPRSSVLIVGDSLTSDIKGGKAYGLDTCWIHPQRYPDSAAADYVVRGVRELG